MMEMVSKLLLRMSEVEPLSVRWAWDGFVPMGRLSMITGGPGVGKSLVALQIAALMTRGTTMLEGGAVKERDSGIDAELVHESGIDQGAQAIGSGNPRCFSAAGTPRGVLVLSAADDARDTVLPRLIAAGADPSLVFCLRGTVQDDEGEAVNQDRASARSGPDRTQANETSDFKMRKRSDDSLNNEAGVRPFLLSRDMQKLSGCVTELAQQGIEIGLIVIDSIDRYLGANEKKSDRIEVVAQLADLATRSQAAVLVTANSSMKSGSRGGTVVYQELFNVARSVLSVDVDQDGGERRIVRSLKQNLTARPAAVSFVIEDGVVEWETGGVTVSTADCVGNVRKDQVVRDDGSGSEVGVEEPIEPLTFWLQNESANEDRTTRSSDLRKRELKRRERKARRASQRRNRCRVWGWWIEAAQTDVGRWGETSFRLGWNAGQQAAGNSGTDAHDVHADFKWRSCRIGCVYPIRRLSSSFALPILRASRFNAHGVHDFVLMIGSDLKFEISAAQTSIGWMGCTSTSAYGLRIWEKDFEQKVTKVTKGERRVDFLTERGLDP
jgi:KaiC/GvpD/RAD55 family RecA-like ATPase